MKSKHITILASLLPRTQQCKSVSKGSCTAESASVWVQAANAEASIEKGHGRLYASTSARSSLLLLQLSQPGYRLPVAAHSQRHKGQFTLLPLKGSHTSQHPALLATSLLCNDEGKKSMIQTFRLLPGSLSSPRRSCNILVGRLI